MYKLEDDKLIRKMTTALLLDESQRDSAATAILTFLKRRNISPHSISLTSDDDNAFSGDLDIDGKQQLRLAQMELAYWRFHHRMRPKPQWLENWMMALNLIEVKIGLRDDWIAKVARIVASRRTDVERWLHLHRPVPQSALKALQDYERVSIKPTDSIDGIQTDLEAPMTVEELHAILSNMQEKIYSKGGQQRKYARTELCKLTSIPRSTLYGYCNGDTAISTRNAQVIRRAFWQSLGAQIK